MKGRCPCCGAETDISKAKFCSECGTKIQQLQHNAESITCNGEDDGKPCIEKISLGKRFCPNCGRQVDQNEFLLGNCQKCGEYSPASSKLCTKCLQTVTSETNARTQLGKFGTKRIQTLTRSFSPFPSCERCGKEQLPHWSFCLNCGEKHRFKPREPEVTATAERTSLRTHDDDSLDSDSDTDDSEKTQSKMKTKLNAVEFSMKPNLGSDEFDDQILITLAEASVIKRILDNESSRTTNTPAMEKAPGHSYSRSTTATANDTSFDQLQSEKQKIATVERILGLHRPTNTATNQKVPVQTAGAAFHNPDDLANTASTQNVGDPAEEAEFKNVLDQCGYSELMKIIEHSNNKWRDTKIAIAITGESGSGKSTLINALRGLKDDHPEAAIPGCIEATMERKDYPHPDNRNLVLWDLPGVGTPNFPQETYIERARFHDYDFIIMVSQSRYTITDTWLADKIKTQFPDSNLFFVRTKIDVDLGSTQKGRSIPLSAEKLQEVFITIKKNCLDNLQTAGIINPYVFMVDNHDKDKFEFGKLANMLVAKVSAFKKDALIMTIQGFTKEIVAAKKDLCIERMKAITKLAAIAAVKSDRKNKERLEVDILKQEMVLYKQQLGIDTNSLDIIARRFGIDREEVYIKLNSETHVILRNFEQFYSTHDRVLSSNRHSLPLMGQFFLLRSFQKQCLSVLKIVLDKCIDENNTLQKNIAVWLYIQN